jgi:2,4-dienoyl-CoA reductase-like NADH-dependent reductase (Old Yellow Enzyme family)/thioredoxin reductase
MDTRIAALFAPLALGPVTARSRVMMPPHTSAIGNLWGTEDEAAKNLAYLRLRAESGIAWATIPGRLGNVLNPGFEPSGMSAEVRGVFRLPLYGERVRRFADVMHEAGALAATQFTMIGGYPHGPSPVVSSPYASLMPHVLTTREIGLLVEEYRFSARTARAAGIDVFELHMNHDDLQEWFISPMTNQRDDEYGGDLPRRLRFTRETLAAIRDATGPDRCLGVRMNVFEHDERGYDLDGGLAIAAALEATGLVDYFHMVHGTPWGNPSYIQPHFHEPGAWSRYARRYKETLTVPVIHTGLVDSVEVAADIVGSGDADMVGMARAHIADGELLAKARTGTAASVRPCVGGNDCINRRYVDGLPFGCAVNPHAGRELEGPWGSRRIDRDLLVVGGGPAGLELAALAAEAGARVTLVERSTELGGQLRTAAAAPSFGRYGDYLDWQADRIRRLGVDVQLGAEFTAGTATEIPATTAIAFATGSVERVPAIPGVASPQVLLSRDVLTGRVTIGRSVAVVAQDDHMAPIALAEFLAAQGAEVTLIYSTQTPAPLLGRYIAGSALGRLDSLGVGIRTMEEVVGIEDDTVRVRHIYSGRQETVGGFDTVVLSCGGVSDSAVFDAVSAGRQDVHVLGDAYAPRRLVFATRQAIALAELLITS